MDKEYGVGITNRYAFLEDDVDDIVGDPPAAAEKKVPEKKPVDKKKVPAGKDSGKKKAVVAAPPKPKEEVQQVEVPSGRGGRGNGPTTRGRGSGSGRGGGGGRNGDERGNKENCEERPSRGGQSSRGFGGGRGGFKNNNPEPPTQDFDDWSETPPVREHSVGRGGRGRGTGRGGFTRRRDFDRVSGSDKSSVKATDKRDGAGSHNWGTYKNDEEEMDNQPSDFGTMDDTDRTENGQGDANMTWTVENEECKDGEETTVATPIPEEPKTITLEQWKAQQQPKQTPAFNIRKANEGEDPSKWNNLVLKKKENLDDDELVYEEVEGIWVPQRAGRVKLLTDIGFHFGDRQERQARRGFRPQFPRGGGGTEGQERHENDASNNNAVGNRGSGFPSRGRGGGGRGFGRRDRPVGGGPRDPPRVDDVMEYPSLIC